MDELALFGESPFDMVKDVDEGGEFWDGRKLMPLMQYSRWQTFVEVIEKAKASLALVSGQDAADEAFSQVTEVTEVRNLGDQRKRGYRLTRFGAYLTAMAGDDTKEAVAEARVYFAVKTREAEAAPRHQLPASFAEALELAAKQARELEAAAPMVEQAEQHRAADSLTAVGDFANKLVAWAQEKHGVRVLHQEVWDFLGEIGLVIRGNTIRHNHPTADGVRRGLVRGKESTVKRSTGSMNSVSPRLTAAGEGWAWDRAVKRIEESGSLLRKAVSA